MSKETTKTPSTDLQERQVKALETIANAIDALSLWFEEIDKDEWGDRTQFYLAEFMKVAKNEDQEGE